MKPAQSSAAKILLTAVCCFFGLFAITIWYQTLMAESVTFTLDNIPLMLLLYVCLFAVSLALVFKHRAIGEFCYTYRYPLALAVFVTCVLLELSGSSIECWKWPIGNSATAPSDVILGKPRPVRGDDWRTSTPMALSQYYNDFAYYSQIIRGTTTDTFVVYGQPVADILIVLRPFYLGFLFLDPSHALSFYWCGKLIALFLVSFEMGMLLTDKRKLLSLAFSFMVGLAPVVQWWFGTNSFPEMLIYGQGLVLLLHLYLTKPSFWKRFVCVLGMALAAGAYLMVLYPAWQIPFFYIFLGLGIWVVIKDRRQFSFDAKRDILPIFIAIAVSIFLASRFFAYSSQTIQTVVNTVYPGERIETGGGFWSKLWSFAGNLLLPIFPHGIPDNQSESALFFDFFPAGILLSLWIFFREKKFDACLIIMLVLTLFIGTYCSFGFPRALAELTLMSHSAAHRAFIAVGFLNVVILVRAVALFDTRPPLLLAGGTAILFAIFNYHFSAQCYGVYIAGMRSVALSIFVALAYCIIFLSASRNGKLVFSCLVCASLFFAGSLVNPVQKGLDAVYENDLAHAITQVNSDKPGLWLVETQKNDVGLCDYPIILGAATINSTNVYPCMERWQSLDPSGASDDIFNRYAHITITLTAEEETELSLTQCDLFAVLLNVADLEKLHPDYVLTGRRLEEYNSDLVSFELVAQAYDSSIYAVSYTN